jgi:lauroyl/myristoyl acyltransferase
VVARLRFSALAGPGKVLGFVAGSILRIRRRPVEVAMRRAGVGAPAPHVRALFCGLGQGALELLWLAGASRQRGEEALARHVRLDMGALDGALAAGPVVLAATHTGSWELAAYAAARALAARKRRLVVVAKPVSSPAFHGFMMRLRVRFGLSVVAPAGALRAARRALSRGDVVAMPIDQVPDRARHGERLPFLGEHAWVDRGPATLAARAGAALVVTAAERRGARQVVRVLAVIHPPAAGESAQAWIGEATRKATAALEAFVEDEPGAWLWLHRRWRAPLERGAARADGDLVATPHLG